MQQMLHIKTYNRCYAQAQNGGGGVVSAVGPWSREWETFTIESVDASAVSIENGNNVYLRSLDGHIITRAADNTLQAIHQDANTGPDDVFTVIMAHDEGKKLVSFARFGLLAANGQYICALSGGGDRLLVDSSRMREWETFTAEFHPEPPDAVMRVNMRTADGVHFLQAASGGGGVLTAQAPWAREWETFDLLAADQLSMGFPPGAFVHLRTNNGYNYVQALSSGGSLVTAMGPWAREWETFTLVLPAGTKALQPGGTFGLRTQDKHYITASNGGGGAVTATTTKFGPMETFTFTVDVLQHAVPLAN